VVSRSLFLFFLFSIFNYPFDANFGNPTAESSWTIYQSIIFPGLLSSLLPSFSLSLSLSLISAQRLFLAFFFHVFGPLLGQKRSKTQKEKLWK